MRSTSERERAEQASEAGVDPVPAALQLQTLLDQVGVAVAASDEHGRLTMLSPAMAELLGAGYAPVAEEDLATHYRLYDSVGGLPLRTEDLPLARGRRGEVVRDALVSTRTGDGRTVHLRCNAAPLRDETGQLCGAIAFAHDVTAERAAGLEQAELRRRLVDLVQHEVRTPLAVLLGHLELLDDRDGDVPPDVRRSLAALRRAGGRLEDLVQAVTELADLESTAHLRCADHDVAGVVRQVVADVADDARSRGLVVRPRVPESLPAVVDGARLARALRALVDNALTYAPPASDVLVSATGDDDAVRLEVRDAGSGIPAGDRDRLQEPFERGRHPDQPVAGRGLGLALARTVVAAHGGRLLLEDGQPHGLRATVLLPRAGAGAGARPGHGAAPDAEG